jgi:hypothetical protein
MSDTPPPTPSSQPAGTASRGQGAAAQLSSIVPVALIGFGALVGILALYYLFTMPRANRAAELDAARIGRIESRFDVLDGLREQTAALGARVEQLTPLEARLRAVEERPGPPDIRPLEAQIAAFNERAGAIERNAAQVAERAIANERRLTAVEGRPVFDPATVPERAAFDALAGRVERLSERLEANTARLQNIEAEQTRRLQDAARAQDERLRAAEQAVAQRVSALEGQAAQRAAALEAQLGQRLAAVETALGDRLAAAERSLQRLAALEGRTARLAAVDGLQRALSAGQALGPALSRVEDPPQALARFAQTAPPTEASLRLSFEDAARAARAASDAATSARQPDGSRAGVVDSALARLGGLVTVRRGEEVVWGDAAEAELERARRALDAGDLEGSLGYIGKLPPAARAAMDGWTEQARALLAARNALRQIAATAG